MRRLVNQGRGFASLFHLSTPGSPSVMDATAQLCRPEHPKQYGAPLATSVRTGGGWDVALTLPDGRRTTFTFTPELHWDTAIAKWTPPPAVHARLLRRANPYFLSKFPSPLRSFFPASVVASFSEPHGSPRAGRAA